MSTISLCMIVKNEERFLRQCLGSVKDLVDEMIIVDTGSTDRTKEIAKEFRAKIFDFKWNNDFSAARNFSLSKATKDWILVLDADEAVSAKDVQRISELADMKEFDGFFFTLRNYANSQHVYNWEKQSDPYEESKKYDTWYAVDLIRMFRNKKSYKFKNKLHEVVDLAKAKVGITHIPIHHFGWEKYKHNKESKRTAYKNILLETLKEDSDDLKANYELARSYIEDLDFAKAEEILSKSIKIYEKLSESKRDAVKGYLLYESLGQVYLLSGKHEQAVDALNKSLIADGKNPSTNALLGRALVMLGRYEEAKACFRSAIHYLRNNPNMLISMDNFFNSYGIALLNTDKFKEACHAFAQATKANPLNANAFNNLGVALLKMKNAKNALIAFKKAVELGHENNDEISAVISKIESKLAK